MTRPGERWPALPVQEWAPSRDTLHLWSQVVGKVRLANEPVWNHWWNVPLYLSSRGFTSSLVPHPTGPAFQMDFDLIASRFEITTVHGGEERLALEPRTVADFHEQVMAMLERLGVPTEIWPVPVEIEGAVPFPEDHQHDAFDADAVRRFWLGLVEIQRVFETFRSRFIGKCSPVHLFWGALDLAVTRFSGREAPPHPGGAPNVGPHVMHEAYSHEVSSAGYWAGGPGEEGCFYSYAYPEPPGYREWPLDSPGSFDEELGEFVLPYEVVRTAEDPDATLLSFLQSTYDAAATCARWDREALERSPADWPQGRGVGSMRDVESLPPR